MLGRNIKISEAKFSFQKFKNVKNIKSTKAFIARPFRINI